MFVIFKKNIFYKTIFILSLELDAHTYTKTLTFIKRLGPQHIDFKYINQTQMLFKNNRICYFFQLFLVLSSIYLA